MILVDYQIKELCEKGLVFPYDPRLVNPSSLDIRLGKNIIAHNKGDNYLVRLLKKITGQEIIEPHEELIDISCCTKENPYWLHPNEFILSETLEYLTLGSNIAAQLKLKSSRAREGLTHALAGWIDNGFYGVLTLEIKNYSTVNKIAIYPGLRIGQLIIHQTETPHTPYQGKYAGFKTVVSSLDK